MYREISQLHTSGAIDDYVYTAFLSKQFDSHMDIKFYCYDYSEFSTLMKDAGFIYEGALYSHELYSKYFPLFVFSKKVTELHDSYRNQCGIFKAQIRGKIIEFLSNLSAKSITQYSESIGSQYFILNTLKIAGWDFQNESIHDLLSSIRSSFLKNLHVGLDANLRLVINYEDKTILEENEKLVEEATAIKPNIHLDPKLIVDNEKHID